MKRLFYGMGFAWIMFCGCAFVAEGIQVSDETELTPPLAGGEAGGSVAIGLQQEFFRDTHIILYSAFKLAKQ